MTHWFDLIYIPIKFHEDIPVGYWIMGHTIIFGGKCKINHQWGITQKLRKGEQSFFYATHRLDINHIPVKFHEDIPYSYRVCNKVHNNLRLQNAVFTCNFTFYHFSPIYLIWNAQIQKVLSEGPTQLWQFLKLTRGERVQIPLTADHYQHASKMPFKWPFAGMLIMAQQWIFAGLVALWFSRVIFHGIRPSIAKDFQGRGGVRPVCLPSGSAHVWALI